VTDGGQQSDPHTRVYWRASDGRYRYRSAPGEREEFALSDPASIAWIVEVAKYVGSAAVGGIIGNRSDAILQAISRRVRGTSPGDRRIALMVARQAIEREFGEVVTSAPIRESVSTDGGRGFHFEGVGAVRYEVLLRNKAVGTVAARTTRDESESL
jgi:hypothetical protein